MRLAGLDLPIRASVALLAATVLVLLDYTGAWRPLAGLLPQVGAGDVPGRDVAVERLVIYGFVPVLVVWLGFRDSVARYGLRLALCRPALYRRSPPQPAPPGSLSTFSTTSYILRCHKG